RLPCVRASLASTARLLLAAECATDLGARGTNIDVCDATIRTNDGEEFLHLANIGRENRRRKALSYAVMQCQRVVEVGILHDVEDRREGFIQDRTNLFRHLDQRGLHIIGLGMWLHAEAVAAGYPSAKLSRLCKRFL